MHCCRKLTLIYIFGCAGRHFASHDLAYESRLALDRLPLIGVKRSFSDVVADLTLPPLEAAGFLLHRERPAVAGLTFAPQAFNVSVCPTATSILIPSSLTFLAAL